MTAERINPPELSPPAGFSHAVVVTGSRTVFLAGQTALDANGKVVGDSLLEQFERALTNLLTALRAAGGTPFRPRPRHRLRHGHRGLPDPRTRTGPYLADGGTWLSGHGGRGGRTAVGRAGDGGARRLRCAAVAAPANLPGHGQAAIVSRSTGTRCGATIRPSGSSSPVSSKTIEPSQSRFPALLGVGGDDVRGRAVGCVCRGLVGTHGAPPRRWDGIRSGPYEQTILSP
ncbi:hypothetical protein SALBM311S_01539 [Streptomyces alboniger]